MEILKIAGIALIGVMLAALMKSIHKEFSIYIILATVISKEAEITIEGRRFLLLQSIYGCCLYGKTFFPVILRCWRWRTSRIWTAQLCRDAGESAVGGKVELAER